MKRFAISFVLVLAVIASTATVAQGKSAGRSCTYRGTSLPSVSLKLSGYDLDSMFCDVFNHSFHGTRVYAPIGRAYCEWSMYDMDVTVTIYARTAFMGHVFCKVMVTKVNARDWYRVY